MSSELARVIETPTNHPPSSQATVQLCRNNVGAPCWLSCCEPLLRLRSCEPIPSREVLRFGGRQVDKWHRPMVQSLRLSSERLPRLRIPKSQALLEEASYPDSVFQLLS